MAKKEIIIGSRASKLALTQTNIVIEELKEHYPDLNFRIKEIKTIGDKILDKTLNKIGGKGLFVKEIEAALLKGEIDIAVHSMKDVPSKFPENLEISAITKREDVRDILITKDGSGFDELKKGAIIGTSSLRRGAQLKGLRNDINIVPIRGNVQTRISKIKEMNLDAVILAAAGLNRLGLKSDISMFFDINEIVPAVGQGALGIETRKNDEFIKNIVSKINHEYTEIAIKAERTFMKILNGGCHVPIGAHAFIEDKKIKMVGLVADVNGDRIIRIFDEDDLQNYEKLGKKIAEEVLNRGGKEILDLLEDGE
ncbi:hydroxymethylbilane synthase [Paramaledivibacter caminithermalis]|jgi:hydroxymethylbilane synthase|uniref:Porphobilinogen deaminase n=1 Tax=Paramaledivibacter caminithermalis (strain DSM 15212 / CIP 107654 / DViRD3) TaxID=1121301 RepID=A0A1M6ML00_PARC5|nr:hydroxymethylbilane synthase [Paramaledivibacter caminithermalis]SHJ84129.1 hydroxymethylbilane synthase [Paramaledivibacter caminithermalis DSM 15212]